MTAEELLILLINKQRVVVNECTASLRLARSDHDDSLYELGKLRQAQETLSGLLECQKDKVFEREAPRRFKL